MSNILIHFVVVPKYEQIKTVIYPEGSRGVRKARMYGCQIKEAWLAPNPVGAGWILNIRRYRCYGKGKP